jgi:hypothetical protein
VPKGSYLTAVAESEGIILQLFLSLPLFANEMEWKLSELRAQRTLQRRVRAENQGLGVQLPRLCYVLCGVCSDARKRFEKRRTPSKFIANSSSACNNGSMRAHPCALARKTNPPRGGAQSLGPPT